MDKTTIDSIVWWIPIKKLRHSIREFLEFICNIGIKIDSIDNKLINTNEYFEYNIFQKKLLMYVSNNNIKNDTISNALKNNDINIFNEALEVINFINTKGVFIDIGANLGIWSFPFALKGFKVYGFEANPLNYYQLNKTNEINKLNCNFLCTAITKQTGIYSFVSFGPYGHLSNDFIDKQFSESIVGYSIDDWYKDIQFKEDVSLIKMDIEGSEIDALRGMVKFLTEKKYPALFVESNGWCLSWNNMSPKNLIDEFSNIGYLPCEIVSENTLKIIKKHFQVKCVDNIFFIHKNNINNYNIVDSVSEDNMDEFYEWAINIASGKYYYNSCELYYYAFTIKNNASLIKHRCFKTFLEYLKNDNQQYNKDIYLDLIK